MSGAVGKIDINKFIILPRKKERQDFRELTINFERRTGETQKAIHR